eukprot:TRINITY_DN1844_c0_g2_i1.p1 TRINITY_DN1844_c0_g2~~TRINITY_DN1844_c0_g2_i1.p1  ORF type:complete len:528 (+),score=158.80 TRINITY_DN1844_c0_g2_i1:213-1586(+)
MKVNLEGAELDRVIERASKQGYETEKEFYNLIFEAADRWPEVELSSSMKRKQYTDSKQDGLLSVHYGDDTSVKISVTSVDVEGVVAPRHGVAFVTVSAALCNTAVHRDIRGVFSCPLPKGATVSSYSIFSANNVYEAVAVPKRHAAKVEYVERERGRAVGTAGVSGGNVFSATVYPLPLNTNVMFSFDATIPLETRADSTFSLRVPASDCDTFSARLRLIPSGEPLVAGAEDDDGSFDPFLVTGRDPSPPLEPACMSGLLERRAHFSAFVSPAACERALSAAAEGAAGAEAAEAHAPKEAKEAKEAGQHLALLWDTSASCADAHARFVALARAFAAASTACDRVSLFTFTSCVRPVHGAMGVPWEAALELLPSADSYDGGTRLAALDKALDLLEGQGVSSIAVLSDGMDVLEAPARDLASAAVPVHTFHPASGTWWPLVTFGSCWFAQWFVLVYNPL